MTYPIVTVTLDPAVDRSCAVPHVTPGRKLCCAQSRFDPGGGGINVARAIKRLGGCPSVLWSKGGPLGMILGQLLDREGVANDPLPIKSCTRENVIVYEQETEQQFCFGMQDAQLLPDELEAWRERIRGLDPAPHYLVLSGSLPPGAPDDFYATLVSDAPPSTRVVLDTCGQALREGLDAGVFLVKPNPAELATAVERELSGDAALEKAARELVERAAAEVVVVSLGAAGALLATAEGVHRLHAPCIAVRSKLGAGDSMLGGLVLGLERNCDLEDAFALGVAAGTAAVAVDGAELCRLADTERLKSQLHE